MKLNTKESAANIDEFSNSRKSGKMKNKTHNPGTKQRPGKNRRKKIKSKTRK